MTAPVRTARLQNNAAGLPAEDERLLTAFFTPGAGLHALGGIWPAAAGYQGEVTLLSDTQIQTNPFRATIPGTQSGVQGDYTIVNDQVRTSTIGARNATNTRLDLLVTRVRDTAYSPNEGANDVRYAEVVPGVPAASPVAPATPVNALVHGTITVPRSGGAAVTFTPASPGYSVALGGIRPSGVTDTLAPAGTYDGEPRWNPSTGLLVWQAATARWRPGYIAYVTSTTRPTGNVPYGQRIIETDTLLERMWDGANWEILQWHGTDRTMAAAGGLPGMSCSWAFTVPQNFASNINNPAAVTGPPTVHAALFTYQAATAGATIKCNAKGRVAVWAYAFSDTGLGAGYSLLRLVTSATAPGNLTERRHRNGGYPGCGTLDQWLIETIPVAPGDTFGLFVDQALASSGGVAYQLSLQVVYL